MLKRNLLEEKSKKENKNKKAIAKMLLLCPALLLVQRRPHPARPLGVRGPFFVRSALKKYALIHKKMLLYSFILLSPQNCT